MDNQEQNTFLQDITFPNAAWGEPPPMDVLNRQDTPLYKVQSPQAARNPPFTLHDMVTLGLLLPPREGGREFFNSTGPVETI